MIRVRYDREADALAVEFRERAKDVRTKRVSDTVNVDFDGDGRIVLVEILDASTHVSRKALDELPTAEDDMTLAEAAAESELTPATLRVLLNRGRLKGRKRGRDWFVDATSLVNYLESRSAAGRPANNPKARRKTGS